MTQQEKKEELRHHIQEALTPLIDDDYVFLELPFYINPGDALIWKGTEQFLSELPYRCLYRAAFSTFDYQPLPKNVIIVMQGGGNFGDLYRSNQDFRLMIMEKYPDNRIVILPQTVYYKSALQLIRDVWAMRKHRYLTICARDAYSYDFLRRYGFTSHVLMVPDMAFYCQMDDLRSLTVAEDKKLLVFKRVDAEQQASAYLDEAAATSGADVSDWEVVEHPNEMTEKLRTLILSQHPHQEINDYCLQTLLPYLIASGVRQISQYGKVVSTRLHAAIIAVLLEKETVVLNNSYGKNLHFYDTWLKNTERVSCVGGVKPDSLLRRMTMSLAVSILKISSPCSPSSSPSTK